jgi:2-succinyl-5-enolpyruvyl-6-hydroxy-3-cyclohexene-1-carboxylate synthase
MSYRLQEPLNPTYAYVGAFVDELQRAGLQHVVICPGSRSTPLAMAFAAHSAIRTWMHVDERSAAFFALGMAKRLHAPVALVCTSGTAAANFFPAIVEAKLSRVSLLVLTADRPHELRDDGAPQSIDQNRLYGTHVKWFVEVALPEAANPALRYIRTLADRATALTQAVPAGPVHLNFPFREPLTPDPIASAPLPSPAQRDRIAWYGRPDNHPYTAVPHTQPSTLDAHTLDAWYPLLERAARGLIIVGPHSDPALPGEVEQLAELLGYPVLADPLSQLRTDGYHSPYTISSYDAFLRLDAFVQQAQPEVVIRLGAMPTSKPVLLYLQHYAACPQIIVNEYGTWEEPTQLAQVMIQAAPSLFCTELRKLLRLDDGGSTNWQPRRDEQWLYLWQQSDKVTRVALQSAMQDMPNLFEGRVFSELSALLPENSMLYVGNSMPVRDLDTFFWPCERHIHIMGNRGANGIDGVVSSALGVSAASSLRHQRHPTVLVIGDLSFFHDLNGLLAAKLHRLDLIIVLINNDGGGIFSFLPQAAYPEYFEQLFGTPTGLQFQPVVQMYGGTFQRVETWHQFREAVRQGITVGGLHVVEVVTERTSNVQMHRRLWRVAEQALREQGVLGA